MVKTVVPEENKEYNIENTHKHEMKAKVELLCVIFKLNEMEFTKRNHLMRR